MRQLRLSATPGVLQLVHRLVSFTLLPTALAAGIVTVLGSRTWRRRWTGWAVPGAVVLTAVAASITGYLLPWDQLALWAVTVGNNTTGYLDTGARRSELR